MEDKRSDDELVTAARGGSEEAFEALVLRHRRRATSVARRFFTNLGDAEELAQEALVRAYLKLGTLKRGVPFKNWLVRITINLCLDRLRQKSRRGERLVSEMSEEETVWVDRQLLRASEEKQRQEELARESAALLGRVLCRLSPKDQAVLHMLYGEELDVSEIASLMGWSRSNVKVRAFRARRALRRALEELGETGKEQAS